MNVQLTRFLAAVALLSCSAPSFAGDLFDLMGLNNRKPAKRVFPQPGPVVAYQIRTENRVFVFQAPLAPKAAFSQPVQLFTEPTQSSISLLSEAPALFTTIKVE